MLKTIYFNLLAPYQLEAKVRSKLWQEVERNYSRKNRFYHNWEHLEAVHDQLIAIQSQADHWESLLFTLFYHDIIYNAFRRDNEEKSAALAAVRMGEIGVIPKTIQHCKDQIIATKGHNVSDCMYTNFFTDADLSILGKPWNTYASYSKNIRKEYAIYPNFIYYPGRKKVIEYFLAMDRIFKTEHFFDKFERRVRSNLLRELKIIKKSISKNNPLTQ